MEVLGLTGRVHWATIETHFCARDHPVALPPAIQEAGDVPVVTGPGFRSVWRRELSLPDGRL